MTMTLMLMNELQISILKERANADHSMIQGKVGGKKRVFRRQTKIQRAQKWKVSNM